METLQQQSEVKCLTCGHMHTGTYCPECGEKVLDHEDKRIVVFFEEFFHLLFHADSKFLRSLKGLFIKPGQLTSDFNAGRRKIYTPPLTLFFIGNVIYFLIAPVDIVSSHYISQTQGQVYSKSITPAVEKKMKAKKWTEVQMEERYNEETSHISKMMLILLVFLFSIPVSILYFNRSGYYSDHLAFATEIVSFMVYCLFLLIPWLFTLIYILLIKLAHYRISESAVNSYAGVLPLLLLLWLWITVAAKRIYKQNFAWTLVKSLLICISTIPIIIFYRYVLFYLTLWML